MRIMSTDFSGTNFNYYIDKSTGETKELPSKIKKQLISHLKENIRTSVKDLKDFLIKNKIFSQEKFQDEIHKIQKYVDSLVKIHANSIKSLFKDLEG